MQFCALGKQHRFFTSDRWGVICIVFTHSVPHIRVLFSFASALAELERAGRAILKCAQLVPDMETETEEHTSGDDLDREEELKTALEKSVLARYTVSYFFSNLWNRKKGVFFFL